MRRFLQTGPWVSEDAESVAWFEQPTGQNAGGDKLRAEKLGKKNVHLLERTQNDEGSIWSNAIDIQYIYNVDLNVYKSDTSNGVQQVNPITLFDDIGMGAMMQGSEMMSTMNNAEVWKELLNNEDSLHSQYDLIYGQWPENYNDVVIIVDKNNEISDYTLDEPAGNGPLLVDAQDQGKKEKQRRSKGE